MRGFDDFELRLGDIMRGERATMGKSLLDVQRELRIKASYISAIENTDPSAFESPGFIAGYVRSYARYLNLDPEWAFNTFCEEGQFQTTVGGMSQRKFGSQKSAGKGKQKPGIVASPASGVRDPFKQPSVAYVAQDAPRFSGIEPGAIGSVAVLMVLIGAIGYGGWSVLQEVQKVQFTPVEETPGVMSELDPIAPGTQLADDALDVAAAAPSLQAFDRLYRPQALDVPVVTSRDGPIAAIEPGSLGVLAPKEAQIAHAMEQQTPSLLPGAHDSEDPAEIQVVEAGPPQVSIFAVRPAWVRVRAADGTVIFEKILDAGEAFDLPQTEEPPVLRAGNAGSVYFRVGEATYGPAGSGAAVVSDLALSGDNLTAAYALANPETDADLARFTAVAEARQD